MQLAIRLPGRGSEVKASILRHRAWVNFEFDLLHPQKAIDDYTAALNTSGLKDKTKGRLVSSRSIVKRSLGLWHEIIGNCEDALRIPGIAHNPLISANIRANRTFAQERLDEERI